MRMNTVLSLKNVAFSQAGHQLLSGIDFSVSSGQIIGLLGVNGAGKSTTLKIAAGILYPTTGNVVYADTVRIGYVPEQPPLIANWTVKKFLRHACVLQGLPKPHHHALIERVCQRCDLTAIMDKTISRLSKGNRQRVAIAQALLHKPTLLLLDEPTSGLDPQQIKSFRDFLQLIQSETAIVLSSHMMQEVSTLCDRAVIIHEGKQQATLDIAEQARCIMIEFADNVSSELFADWSVWRGGEGRMHQFELVAQNEQDELVAWCLHNQLSIVRIFGGEQSLERTFLQIIGHRGDSIRTQTGENANV